MGRWIRSIGSIPTSEAFGVDTEQAILDVGLVAIGRNEGERLKGCLRSVVGKVGHVVYVDSGSTDDSVAFAHSLGVHVVALDMSVPFTAARARNAGFERLKNEMPNLAYVQFVDGDCLVVDGWIAGARAHLQANPNVAIVAGRRRERYPEASPFNRLADMEWNTPIGITGEVGGDALVEAKAFVRVGGYDPTMIAGEDPELCLRLRQSGREVERLDAEMTLHDAAIFHTKQWWKRTVRAGHAYAESAHMHGSPPDSYRVNELRSILFWGGAIPAAAVGLAPLTLGLSLAGGVGCYGVLWKRVYDHRRKEEESRQDAALYATGIAAGKVPEMQGALQYAYNRFVRGQRSALIEYKA